MRLISYLLYGLFSPTLKKSTIKTPDIISHIRLRAQEFRRYTKELYVCQFFFQLLKIQLYFIHIFCCFRQRARSFYSQLKRAVEPRKIFIMPGHYKKILPAQQPIGAHVLLQPYNNTFLTPKRYNEYSPFFLYGGPPRTVSVITYLSVPMLQLEGKPGQMGKSLEDKI